MPLFPFAALFLLLPLAPPQESRVPTGHTVDATARKQLVDRVAQRLEQSYVFPEVAKAMAASLRERAAQGEYDRTTSARAFARALTEDLQAVSKDKHVRVQHSDEPLPAEDRRPRTPTAQEREEDRRVLRWMNHQFNKVERLHGNVGYLELWGFANPEHGAAETLAAAMNFVAGTDALIVDLRENGGGSPEMVALICSYFFGAEPVHLNDIWWREGNQTQQFWTHREVAGRRYLDRAVYVLTSSRTFSGAEEFAYNLKHLGRATVVGETTGGGAHPGESFRLDDHFRINVPTGRAINPITKTNWEGTGVEPDVAVPARQALPMARLMALKKSLPGITNPAFRAGVQEDIEALEKALGGLATRK